MCPVCRANHRGPLGSVGGSARFTHHTHILSHPIARVKPRRFVIRDTQSKAGKRLIMIGYRRGHFCKASAIRIREGSGLGFVLVGNELQSVRVCQIAILEFHVLSEVPIGTRKGHFTSLQGEMMNARKLLLRETVGLQKLGSFDNLFT